RPLEQFRAGVADDSAELLVDAQEAARGVYVGDADRRILERPAKSLLTLAQRLFHLSATGDVEKPPDAATDTARGILERADVAEQFAAAAVRPHNIHLEIPNFNAGAGELHGHLLGQQFFAVLIDPVIFGLLVRRSAEGGILPERHAGDFAQVGVVRDEPAFRIMGNANPDRHDVQNRLHLIDPTPQLLIEARNLFLS